MKVLIVNTYDIKGGAARAAYRLYKSLLIENIDCEMVVQSKSCDEYRILTIQGKFSKLINNLRPSLDNVFARFLRKRIKKPFSISILPSNKLIKLINSRNPDIVHLHWICGGMLRIEDLKKIKAPIIWSMHDNWVFTGGCHVKWQCDKFKEMCGACPILNSSNENDISRSIWKRKQKTFSALPNITFVGLSNWMTKSAAESSLLKNMDLITLPNAIDTNFFKPLNKQVARELWNFSKNRKLILFGANGAVYNENKGFKHLINALNLLKKEDITLVIFGASQPLHLENIDFDIHFIGHLHDEVSIITLYSAVDVLVVPSIQENLSNSIMESLSCSTPVVAFNIGGNNDMIEHLNNGYLAKPYDVIDLKNGIEYILSGNNYENLCLNSRKKIIDEFDSKLIAKKYINLYQTKVENQKFHSFK